MKKRLLQHFIMLTKFSLLGMFLQCLLLSALFASNGNAQNLSVKEVYVDLDAKSARISKVLKAIEEQTNFSFVYTPKVLNTNKRVTIDVKKKAVSDVLLELSRQARVKFRQVNNNISIQKISDTERGVSFIVADLAPIAVSGVVTSYLDGSPLPGVNIQVKGTYEGTITDIEGRYSINVPDENDTLIFSSVGFANEIVVVGGRSIIDVVMMEDLQSLGEVVVVGYGTQRKVDITSAVSNISEEDFRQSGARNAMDLIQGKVAGLSLTRGSSNPNSGVSLQIRGVNSLSGSNQPLIVIDGIPGGNLDLLQQDDIASITVLKDGSAAAIYGTRANGGVVIVTTKKGEAGEARFDYNTYFRREYERDRPEFLDAEEFRARIADGSMTGSRATDYGHSTDFYGDLLNEDNLSQYHHLSLSGGGDNTTYRASLFYQDLQGIAKANDRQQYGGRLSINHTGLQDRLAVQLNVANNFNKADLLGGVGWQSSLERNPTLSAYNDDGTYFFEPTSTNYLARLEQEKNERDQQTTSAEAKVTLNLLEGLSASVNGAVQRNSYVDNIYRDLDSESSIESYQGGGFAEKKSFLEKFYTLEGVVNYNTTIATHHNINAVAGYSYQYYISEDFNASNFGFVNDIFEENNLNTGSQLREGLAGMGSGKRDNTLIAFFGRINYSLMNKYMASVTLRREGSSRFGGNNKWGYFPAASVGWNISEEEFMQNITFINALKLRVGYGVTGNQDIDNYSSLVTLSGGGVYINPDGNYRQTYGPSRNPNPDLKWEVKKELNFGLDFSLLEDRLGGSIDVYKRTIDDLLGSYSTPVPPYVTNSINSNVGTLEASGVELALNALVVSNEDFTYRIDLAASTGRSKLVSFSNDIFKVTRRSFGGIPGYGALGDAIMTFEGGYVGQFYGKRFAGFDEDGNWLFYKRDGTAAPASELVNSVDPEESDFAVLGNAVPRYFASMTHDFRHKNFGLRVFLRGRFDYDILNAMAISYGNRAGSSNLLESAFTDYAAIGESAGYQYSDYYLEPGDYLKLDEITLSYNFNLSNEWVRNLRVYITGANLATFTKYSGTDPDYIAVNGLGPGVQGLDPYPNTRSFLVGLNVGF